MPDPTFESIRLHLISLRLKEGWTKTELARRVGVCMSLICMIETGRRKPSFKTLSKLAKVFRVRFVIG